MKTTPMDNGLLGPHPTYQCISIRHTTTSHDITVISKVIIKFNFFLYYTAMRKFDA